MTKSNERIIRQELVKAATQNSGAATLGTITSLPKNKDERKVMLGEFPNVEDSIKEAIKNNVNPWYYLVFVEKVKAN